MSKIARVLFILCSFVIIAVGAAGTYVFSQMQPVNPAQTEKVTFVIPRGQSITQIGRRLQEAGLIRNAYVFRYQVMQQNLTNKIQAGTFMISPSMTPAEIAAALTVGTDDTSITVLEGWRVEEIAKMLEEKDLPEFDAAEFLSLAKEDEGYLYPDTYLVPKTADAEYVYQLFRDTFEKKVLRGLEKELDASGRSLEDIITMASIVQREERDPDEMKTVAGVLWNRVEQGMGLNADATLQYIQGYDRAQQDWWAPPLVSTKESTSPYNTYKYAGLPPRPIANPGLDAVRAAASPADTPYMYYIHDNQGRVHYAKTLDEHNTNVQKYLR